jgi:PAS domain-containing protein
LEGLAEPEMCIPYMKRLAEKKNDLILQTDPNGIVILNRDLEIIQMNQAFEKMFSCSDMIIGRKISYLLDPEPFEVLLSGIETEIHQKVKYPNYNLICHQIVYKLEQEKQVVGIFVNITDFEKSETKLKSIKTDTILQAEELIEHQIKMAQEIVRFLGENTAKGEALLSKLIKAIEK